MQTVLITGVAGFVGSNLAKGFLDNGYEVIGIDNFFSGTKENLDKRIKFYKCDVRDEKLGAYMKGCDAIFHLAASTCLPYCREHPLETSEINVTGTVNVLECVRKNDIKKFVYAGSSCAYEGVEAFPTPEDIEARPLYPYAVSKYAGELFTRGYARLYGMDFTITRYFNVYGPAQDYRRVRPPATSAFIMALLRGERPIINGDGEQRRDFIYVSDVNELNMRIMENPSSKGEVFNVGVGKSYSINELFEAVEAQLNTGIKPIYKPAMPGEARITLADISKAKKLLNWQPRVELEEGLKRSIEFLRGKIK